MIPSPLFGTDGIRAVAGRPPLDAATLARLGSALAAMLRDDAGAFRVLPATRVADRSIVIGGDTRESTPRIARQLLAGLRGAGDRIRYVGVASTPEIAWLTRHFGAALGIVISASHNPWQDNGVKCFSPEGVKISADAEARVEARLRALPEAPAAEIGELPVQSSPAYVDDLIARFQPRLALAGKTLALDCANGAVSRAAPRIFAALGARVITLHDRPDGRNINERCGALHPETLAPEVVARRADLGLSFDGDGDRVMFVDAGGTVRDGDFALAILADAWQRAGRLPGGAVIGTVMSNLGLELCLRERGIALRRTPVGDKYIADAMLQGGGDIGGEQSGHILLRGETTTGDGILSALALLEALQGRPLAEACAMLRKCPQVLVNVRVREKKPFDAIPELPDTVRAIETALNGRGRLVLRYSGTENLARVMLEGVDQAQIDGMAGRLADCIRGSIGSE